MDEFPRDHFHYVGGRDVPCTSLTHCPSICDCPIELMASCAVPKKKVN